MDCTIWLSLPDCNLPSGESFVRQALLGQRYFQSRFGKIATVGYNVDSFGHNANLPQLLSKAGLSSYVFMRPEQQEKQISAALFNWEAPSGDQVVTYRLPLYYSDYKYSIREKLRLLHFYDLFTPRAPWMVFYGVGNHGGGPAIEQIKEIIQLKSEGRKIEFSDPERFFAESQTKVYATIRDEMQPHAIGCYSAHSEIKRLNRRAENILGQAERFSVLAKILRTNNQNAPDFEQAWKNVCFNQFHDLLCGVAIKEACDDAITMYREAISIAERYNRIALQRIASRIDTSNSIENLIVFNSSAFEREETIEFELWNAEASESGYIMDRVALVQNDGTRITTQKIEPSGKIGEDRVRFIAKVTVPAFGWARYSIERNAAVEMASDMFVTTGHIGNGIISVDLSNAQADEDQFDEDFDEDDEEENILFEEALLSLKKSQEIDPETIERNKSASYRYNLHITIEDKSDTWSHRLKSFEGETLELGEQFAVVRENGPLRASVEVTSGSEEPILRERIMLRDGCDYIELRAGLDFREEQTLLKFRFLHGCKNPVARYEIPYASIERPVGNNEWPGQSWIDVSEKNGSRGVSVVTDSKYSYQVDATYIYVIAARGALYAHHVPPHSSNIFTANTGEYLDQGWHDIRFLIVPHKGDWHEANLPKLSEQFLQPLIVHTESAHSGDLPSTYSAFECVGDGIRIGAMKLAEDGDGIIVRSIEQRGEKSSCKFKIGETEWRTNFNPFEIKSFCFENGKVSEVDLLERPI